MLWVRLAGWWRARSTRDYRAFVQAPRPVRSWSDVGRCILNALNLHLRPSVHSSVVHVGYNLEKELLFWHCTGSCAALHRAELSTIGDVLSPSLRLRPDQKGTNVVSASSRNATNPARADHAHHSDQPELGSQAAPDAHAPYVDNMPSTSVNDALDI